MAQPHFLKSGDLVTHPDWPAGTTRHVIDGVHLGSRGAYTKSGYKVTRNPDERFLRVDAPVQPSDGHEADDYWAEAGLEKVL